MFKKKPYINKRRFDERKKNMASERKMEQNRQKQKRFHDRMILKEGRKYYHRRYTGQLRLARKKWVKELEETSRARIGIVVQKQPRKPPRDRRNSLGANEEDCQNGNASNVLPVTGVNQQKASGPSLPAKRESNRNGKRKTDSEPFEDLNHKRNRKTRSSNNSELVTAPQHPDLLDTGAAVQDAGSDDNPDGKAAANEPNRGGSNGGRRSRLNVTQPEQEPVKPGQAAEVERGNFEIQGLDMVVPDTSEQENRYNTRSLSNCVSSQVAQPRPDTDSDRQQSRKPKSSNEPDGASSKVIAPRLTHPRSEQSYLDLYDENIRPLVEGFYGLVKQNKAGFELPNVRNLPRKGKTVLEYYGMKTREFIDELKAVGHGSVYMIFNEALGRAVSFDRLRLPNFKYSTKTFLDDKVKDYFQALVCNKPIDRVRTQFIRKPSKCVSKSCYCETRRRLLKTAHPSAMNVLALNNKGNLAMESYNTTGDNFIIECSDACGCSMSCPNRVLQRGPKVPLLIVPESDGMGFGVRAGGSIERGQLICEMNGKVIHDSDKIDALRELYVECHQMGVGHSISLVDETGVGRFINHSCDPNALIINAFSRSNEEEPYVPRIGVYALRKISPGEAINYCYNNHSLKGYDGPTRVCECGAKKCRKIIAML